MASPKMSLKLLVDKKTPRVLFAEVPKEFVDFLFHIFSIPLGTLIELLGSNHMVGCLGKLKDSIQSFHGNYLQPGIKLDDIFNPKTAFNGDTSASSEAQSEKNKKVYRCSNAKTSYNGPCPLGGGFGGNYSCRLVATLYDNSICPSCSRPMNVAVELVTPKEVVETKEDDKKKKEGYVKELVTYMVMDDLVVKPMSTISSITLINKYEVKDLSQLEEKTVSFGKDEGLKLLEASLKTDKVLTTIFMR